MNAREYTVRLSEEARAFFASSRIDGRIKRIIRKKIGLLATHLELGRPLVGELQGYRRLAVSCYRVIYHIREAELIVDVIQIGLRRDIYD